MKEKQEKESEKIPATSFAKITLVHDTQGNQLVGPDYAQQVESKRVCFEGDTIGFYCEAMDPQGSGLEYRMARIGEQSWSDYNRGQVKLGRRDIGKSCVIQVMVRRKKGDHPYGYFDDYVQFRYSVWPKEDKKIR